MKVQMFKPDSTVYSCNVYWLCSDHADARKGIMIDVGRQNNLLGDMQHLFNSSMELMVSRIILTHSHYDHIDNLNIIKEFCNPVTCAFSPYIKGIDHIVRDGEILDSEGLRLMVIHAPGHTSDSICLYSESDGYLFTGDMPLSIQQEDTYSREFIRALHYMAGLPVRKIFPGHGDIIETDAGMLLKDAWASTRHIQLSDMPEGNETAAIEFDTELSRYSEGDTMKTSAPLKVLIVEDDVVNQQYVTAMLKRLGHCSTVAGNGFQALEILQKERFDLVLMDVEMPEMDGLEATRTIREQEKGTAMHIPVIAMTSYAIKGEAKRCQRAGMDTRIRKPVRNEELTTILKIYTSWQPPDSAK